MIQRLLAGALAALVLIAGSSGVSAARIPSGPNSVATGGSHAAAIPVPGKKVKPRPASPKASKWSRFKSKIRGRSGGTKENALQRNSSGAVLSPKVALTQTDAWNSTTFRPTPQQAYRPSGNPHPSASTARRATGTGQGGAAVSAGRHGAASGASSAAAGDTGPRVTGVRRTASARGADGTPSAAENAGFRSVRRAPTRDVSARMAAPPADGAGGARSTYGGDSARASLVPTRARRGTDLTPVDMELTLQRPRRPGRPESASDAPEGDGEVQPTPRSEYSNIGLLLETRRFSAAAAGARLQRAGSDYEGLGDELSGRRWVKGRRNSAQGGLPQSIIGAHRVRPPAAAGESVYDVVRPVIRPSAAGYDRVTFRRDPVYDRVPDGQGPGNGNNGGDQ